MKTCITLNGTWEASYDGVHFDKSLNVPGVVPITEQSYPEPESLKVWYRKIVSILPEQAALSTILRFYAVDRYCRIEINQQVVGEHIGGYDLFEFEITSFLKEGDNEVLVYVEDLPMVQLKNELTGKQDWYGNAIGIWQDVELIFFKNTHFQSVVFQLSHDTIEADCLIKGDWDLIHYRLYTGRRLVEVGESQKSSFKIKPKAINPWSPDTPTLYDLVIDVMGNGVCVDSVEKRVGFRSIEQKDGQILLNGQRIYLKGVLDQDFYPETHYVAPSEAYIREQLLRMKTLGFNTIRYHVKIPPQCYMNIADELGLLIWIDLPYAYHCDQSTFNYLQKLPTDLKQRYSANPAFVMLTLINESWGVNLNEESSAMWLTEFWKQTKKLLPNHLIVDNSACKGNEHVALSDLNDYHFYQSFPEQNSKWNEKIEAFATNQFIPFQDKNHATSLPKVVSEFGTWGLSDPALWNGTWFNYPLAAGVRVSNLLQNPQAIHYESASEAAIDSQWKEYWTLRYQIETMRLYSEIVGYVITELSDISWEINGILDFNRNDKVFTTYIKWLNADILPIWREGRLFLSNTSDVVKQGRLQVFRNHELLQEQPVEMPRTSVVEVGSEIDDEQAGSYLIKVFDEANVLVGLNFYHIHPPIRETHFPIDDKDVDRMLYLAEQGETVMIQMALGKELLGIKAIPNSTRLKHTPSLNDIPLVIDFKGDWFGGFYYYAPCLKEIIAPYHAGMELAEVLTDTMLIGTGNVLIGKYIGWNIDQAAYMVEVPYGKGKVILTSLNLANTSLGKTIYQALV